MKKFRYSRISFLCQLILSLFCVFFLIYGINMFITGTGVLGYKSILIIVVFFVLLSPYIGEYLNRFVEFKDEYVVFNSFRIDKKVRSYNVRYEDILSLEAVKIPLLGIYKIKIKAKNIPYTIPVTWCMKKHNELFYNLGFHVKKFSSDVFIDVQLTCFLKKRGYYESK